MAVFFIVKFPHRQLLLPDGALILPVIPDRIILVKDNKTSNNRLKLGRTSKQGIRRYDVGVDANNFFPVSVKQVIDFFGEQVNIDDHNIV